MERRIESIQAYEDVRVLNSSMGGQSKENYEKTVERLSLEIGEPYRMKREIFVKGDSDAKAKFNALG